MTAMVIATGLNGANIPKERRINNDTLFFFSLLKRPQMSIMELKMPLFTVFSGQNERYLTFYSYLCSHRLHYRLYG